MPKTIEMKDETSKFFSDEELLDFPQESFIDSPSNEGWFTFSEDEVNPEIQWHAHAPQNMASSSSAKVVNHLEKTDEKYTTEAYEPKSALYDTAANKLQNKKNNKASKDFEKFINDELANNWQLYLKNTPFTKRNEDLSTFTHGYSGFEATSYNGISVYFVYLPHNLIQRHFASFDTPIIAAVAYDFIVKAFALDESQLNFPRELYTAEKIQACRDILAPIIKMHQATNSSINNYLKTPKQLQTDLLQFIKSFKQKNNFYFSAVELSRPTFDAKRYTGVTPHGSSFQASVMIYKRKLYLGAIEDKLNATIAHDFMVKVLNLDKKPHEKEIHLHPDLYTEEEIKACGKILLPLLGDKVNLVNQNRRLTTKETASSAAAAAAAPKSTADQQTYIQPLYAQQPYAQQPYAQQPYAQQPYDYLDLLWRQNNPITYAYGGSTYNSREEPTRKEQDIRKNKRARINN